ncbi:MAG: SIMPL domain-containing protein [Psychromonas sp.]
MRKLKSLFLVIVTTCSISVFASTSPDTPHISVLGSATLEVKPDQVTINFQAKALEKDAAMAKQKADQQVADLLVALSKSGFSNEALQRSNLQVREEFQYTDKKRTSVGIVAVRELSYVLTDVTKVNEFLDVLVTANIESIQHMSYGLQAPDKWRLEVRQMAIQDSKAKAANLAEAYQAKLGKIYSVNYQQHNAQPMMMRAMRDEAAESTYQVKNIKITDRVEATFRLQPN